LFTLLGPPVDVAVGADEALPAPSPEDTDDETPELLPETATSLAFDGACELPGAAAEFAELLCAA
jgi:hypothetical protein